MSRGAGLCVAAALLAAACGRSERERPEASARAAERGDRHARAAARRAPAVKQIEGTLARRGDRLVVILPAREPPVTLRVLPSTTVTVNGHPARIESLRDGAAVRAAYREGDGTRPTALSIEAAGAPGAPGG